MTLIDADTAQPGLTIVTDLQTKGKGQRGRTWLDVPGQSLLMSLVIAPTYELEQQFAFNAAIALAVADVLQEIYENWDVRIKWPNDIIINDKKAAGILIENVIRGNRWTYSVVGMGMNMLQDEFPPELPYATSLYIESGKRFSRNELMEKVRYRILQYVTEHPHPATILRQYNDFLFRRGMIQRFSIGSNEFSAYVSEVTRDGMLALDLADGEQVHYTHGAVNWCWS